MTHPGIFSSISLHDVLQAVMTRFRLRDAAEPQTYALGLKEVWEVGVAR